jgi:uroporphyrinogen decarboxylase
MISPRTSPLSIARPGHKQRLLDALNHRFTGEVPFFESEVAGPLVDQIMGRPMGCMRSYQLEAADYVEFLRRTGIDAAYLAVGWSLGRKNFVDDKGRTHYVDGTIKSRADFGQIQIPSLDPVRRRIESYLEAAHGTDLGCVFPLTEAPGLAFTAIGPTDSLLAMHDDPGFVDEFMDRVEAYTLPLIECVLAYPIDVFFLTGPMCAKHGPMVSREMHERFIFPRIEKMVQVIRPRGIPIILHTDGDNRQFVDWFLQMGIAGLHPIEPGSKNWDIYALKEQYGQRFCLCGNINVGGVLTEGTPEQVRAETIEHLRRLAPGGGYICGSSHDITENIPYENFCALAETACAYSHIK